MQEGKMYVFATQNHVIQMLPPDNFPKGLWRLFKVSSSLELLGKGPGAGPEWNHIKKMGHEWGPQSPQHPWSFSCWDGGPWPFLGKWFSLAAQYPRERHCCCFYTKHETVTARCEARCSLVFQTCCSQGTKPSLGFVLICIWRSHMRRNGASCPEPCTNAGVESDFLRSRQAFQGLLANVRRLWVSVCSCSSPAGIDLHSEARSFTTSAAALSAPGWWDTHFPGHDLLHLG